MSESGGRVANVIRPAYIGETKKFGEQICKIRNAGTNRNAECVLCLHQQRKAPTFTNTFVIYSLVCVIRLRKELALSYLRVQLRSVKKQYSELIVELKLIIFVEIYNVDRSHLLNFGSIF